MRGAIETQVPVSENGALVGPEGDLDALAEREISKRFPVAQWIRARFRASGRPGIDEGTANVMKGHCECKKLSLYANLDA